MVDRKPKVLLVQGFFFQDLGGIRIAYYPSVGSVAIFQSELIQTMFAGVLSIDERSDFWAGSMMDHYGLSDISDGVLVDDSFSFDKKYRDRNDVISYKFRREGDLWVGGYFGTLTGSGDARCVVTPSHEGLFEHPRMTDIAPS